MASSPFTLRWGILATGGIAKKFTIDLLLDPATRKTTDVRHEIVAAASSSSQSRAKQFLEEIKAPASAKAYGSYNELVADPDIDIIYVATPHSHHYQNARLCLEAGKHVLLEKAFTTNADQAKILVDLAKGKHLFLMEAVWTRFFPLCTELREIVKAGKIGEVKRVFADLAFYNEIGEGKDFDDTHRMVNMDLAGGALLDLGIYSLTWVFQFLYHILPEPQRKPPVVASSISKYAPTGCDEQTSILLTFPSTGTHGIATTGLRVNSDPDGQGSAGYPIHIQGTLGEIAVSGPAFRPLSYHVIPRANGGGTDEFHHQEVSYGIPSGYGMFWEADECARCIRDGKTESEVMGWRESVVIMEVMDEVRKQASLRYPERVESVEYPLEGF